MTPKKISYSNTAASVLKELERRGFEGYYCEDSEEAVQQVLSLMKENTTAASGGSVTLAETPLGIPGLLGFSLRKLLQKPPAQGKALQSQPFHSPGTFSLGQLLQPKNINIRKKDTARAKRRRGRRPRETGEF